VAAVQAARADADTVVVYLHWGQEGNACPIDVQRSLMPKLVEAGADVIVGGHAHVLLGAGWTRSGAYVSYGLGNLVFYARGGAASQSGVLVLTVQGRAVTDADWRPAVISDGKPVPLSGTAAEQAVGRWNDLRGCTGLSGEPRS